MTTDLGTADIVTRGRSTRELELADVPLTLRACIAIREIPLAHGPLWYLSMFDREIDARVARLQQSLPRGEAATTLCVETLAAQLELTDTIIAPDDHRTLIVARGGCSVFPLYRSAQGQRLRLTTALPLAERPPLSLTGIATSLSCALLGGTYAPNASLETPLADWLRVRRGCVTVLHADGRMGGERPVEVPAAETDGLEASLSAAFERFGASQADTGRSVLELSGGFDSTLAGAAAARPRHAMLGASVEFPYYEFRFEREVQQAVASALGMGRAALDGTELFPYAPLDRWPCFDEPTIFATGVAHAAAVAQYAAAHAAETIYMGHGGDSVFCNDLDALEDVPGRFDPRAFSRQGRQRIDAAASALQDPHWRGRSSGCFVQDAQQDVWIKERFGVTVRTPFTDRAVFQCGRAWSRTCTALGRRPDKSILARALPHLLPDAVRSRRGKVPYDGVWLRAYARHGDHITGTLENSGTLLSEVGFSPRWLADRVRSLAAGYPASGREVMAAYALATWAQAWDYSKKNTWNRRASVS